MISGIRLRLPTSLTALVGNILVVPGISLVPFIVPCPLPKKHSLKLTLTHLLLYTPDFKEYSFNLTHDNIPSTYYDSFIIKITIHMYFSVTDDEPFK